MNLVTGEYYTKTILLKTADKSGLNAGPYCLTEKSAKVWRSGALEKCHWP